MTTHTTHDVVRGVERFGLGNEYVRIDIIPELGAKISSLKDLVTGREWLWTPLDGDGFSPRPVGSAFDEANLGGADECIPTIAACHWRGVDLPDHGEVWSEPWTIDTAAFASHILVTQVLLPISPLRLQRSIALNGREVHLDYTVENYSSSRYEYIWAFHPDFSIEAGDRIILPPDCSSFRIDSTIGCPLGPRGTHCSWPEPEPGVHLDQMEFGRYGQCAIKLFTEPLSTGYAMIRNDRTGTQLTMSFDTRLHNMLGIWLTRGGWRGHHHLALEPTNGAPDALDVAVTDWRRFAYLEGGETRTWTLRLTLSHTNL